MAAEVAALELDTSSADRTSIDDHHISTDPFAIIGELVEAAKLYLGADAAYAGEFSGNRQVFHWIAGDAASFGLRPGASLPVAETFCNAVLSGHAPSFVNDVRANESVGSLPVIRRAGIRSFASVPIMLPDGTLFGTLCAVGHEPAAWDAAQERFLRLVSQLAARELRRVRSDVAHRSARMERIRAAARATQDVRISLQPIVTLRSRVVVGEEALARFADGRPPALWFAEAWEGGFGLELEIATMRAAIRALNEIPSQAYLALNASPATLFSSHLEEILGPVDASRIVLELTEHRPVEDYAALRQRLKPLRDKGMRLAIDDVCAGFASLQHVLQLHPDIIKLDMSLTHGIEHDPALQALASSLLSFSARIGAGIVAEGIETERQLEALSVLGIGFGQGELLGAPGHGIARRLPHAVEFGSAWPERLPGSQHNPHAR
jgi:EAL domain-containing protein (putative c-di-GMP-specific phosphodiesterase class I)